MAKHVKFRNREACSRADEYIRGEVRTGTYAREADGRSKRVGNVGHPLVTLVTLGEDGRHGKRHHRVTGWEGAAFAKEGIMGCEKCVVIRAVWREFRGSRTPRDGFHHHHQHRVV